MKHKRSTANLLTVALLLLMALLLLAMPQVTSVSLAWPDSGVTPTAVTVSSTKTPLGKEDPSGPVEPIPGRAQPTPTPTANPSTSKHWRLYVDAKYGYSVEYPESWYLEPTPTEGVGGTALITSYDVKEVTRDEVSSPLRSNRMKIGIGVATVRKQTRQTLDEWVQFYGLGESELVSKRTVTVNNVPGIELILINKGATSTIVYVANASSVYYIYAVPFNSVHADTFRLMIETFTFGDWKDRTVGGRERAEILSEHVPVLTAPAGFRLPFVGFEYITCGPGCSGWHQGASAEAIDFGLNYEEVRAVEAGTVVFSEGGWNDGFGELMKVQHSNGMISWYTHLSSRHFSTGQTVAKCQVLAISGNTGNSTGAHLHHEVRSGGSSVWIRDLP